MRIDIHTHAFHPVIASKAVHHLNVAYDLTCEGSGIITDLDDEEMQAGIDVFTVLCAATAPAQVIPANNHAIRVHNSDPRAIAFGTMHPGYAEWEKELDRLERNGIRGLKLHPDFQGFAMDDPALFPIFEACQGRFIILFHVGSATDRPLEAPTSPWKARHVHACFPRLDMIAAHFGGYQMWGHALEVFSDPPGEHLWFDTSSTSPFVNTATLRRLLAMVPEDHYFFGTDWPLYTPEEERARFLRVSGCSEAFLERLMGNAAPLLRQYGMLPDGDTARLASPPHD